MDQRLRESLQAWHDQIEALEKAERRCLSLEAQEDTEWSRLFLDSQGKNVAEREAEAYANEGWKESQKRLVDSRVSYNRERRILELKQAEFNSEYLSAKHESEAIARHPRGIT